MEKKGRKSEGEEEEEEEEGEEEEEEEVGLRHSTSRLKKKIR